MSFLRKYYSILFLLLLFVSLTTYAQCDANQVARISKKNIEPPYKYSNSDFKPIVFDSEFENTVNVEFTAFKDLNYKMIFCSSNVEERIDINIYEKGKSNKKVFDSSQTSDSNFWIFEPPKHGKYAIEYVIHKSSSGEAKDGCIIMIVGFK